jgi:hypothetical protein
MQRSDHTFARKQPLTFASIAVCGGAALLLGLALILFAHYHERAYIFLGLGAGGFIGGIAGIITKGSRVKAALSYGLIALGIMGMVIGLNYVADRYGPAANRPHGEIVIALSLVAILAGIVGALNSQPAGGMAAFASVMTLGVIASLGLVALTIGTIYLVMLPGEGYAFTLLGVGALCLIGGIACGMFAQSTAMVSRR